MTMCFVCELDHGDGACPDCIAMLSWEQKKPKTPRKGQPWADRKAAIERRKAREKSEA